jgi:hypothetical protein
MTKKNDIAIRQQTELSPYEPFAREGESAIHGQHLKFVKGAWLIDGKEVSNKPRFVVNLDEAQYGWMRWFDHRPVQQIWRFCIDRTTPLPSRNDIGHLDESLWETNSKGDLVDPWEPTLRLAMRQIGTNADTTFLTSSKWGGPKGIRKLFAAYEAERLKYSELWPVVDLGCEVEPSKNYGKVPQPRFPIVGWRAWDGGEVVELPPGGVTPDDPRTMIGQEISDEIPF